MVDVSERMIAIIGGGAVAARKARGLLAAGATRVRCVSLAFAEDFPAEVQRIVAPYAAAHLDGAQLVFATTNDRATNDAVARDARARGVLVNRADDDDDDHAGDFSTPAKYDAGALAIMVSAASAALSAAVRDHLAQRLDPRYVEMAEAMREIRPKVRASGLAPRRRAAVFNALAREDALHALHTGGAAALHAWLAERYPELNNG